ncbi:MAG: hypothetical protein KAI47_02145, partial [Deltaproteobacteria bacterium]|nr:hypothetical protein [Deltaproteobacteria bacterium]
MTASNAHQDPDKPEDDLRPENDLRPEDVYRPTAPSRWSSFVTLLASVVISFALYAHTLGGGFVYDDIPLLVANDCHKDLSHLGRLFDFSRPTVCNQRPLRFLSFAFDYALFGQNPAAFRATNLVLHGLVVWLALLVLWRVTGDRRLALTAAAIFLFHPIATEATAYISGRRDLLAAVFSLLAAWAVLPTAMQIGARLPRWRALLALLALACAFFSHDGTVAIPFALALFALARRWPRRPALDTTATAPASSASTSPGVPRFAKLRTALQSLRNERRCLPLTFGMLLALAFALWSITRHNPSTRHTLWGDGLGGHIATVLRVHAHYLHQLVWPTDLLADYSPQAFDLSHSLLDPSALVALILIAGLLVGAIGSWRKHPLIAATILAYFGLLIPSSQIVIHHELAAEHRLYLPSLLVFSLAAAGLVALARRFRYPQVITLATTGILLTLALLTVKRAVIWTSGEFLWSTTVAAAPRCARAHSNLGAIYATQGHLSAAQKELESALTLRPKLCAARENLGQVLLDRGHMAPRLAALRRAVRCKPSIASYRHLAQAELRLGFFARAEAAARKALSLRPNAVALLYLRG